MIAKPFDLGAVPSLYGKPKTYARFLGQELFFVYKGRLLIVMPDGYGASRGGKPLPSAQRVLDTMPPPGKDGSALVAAATRAVQRLASQEGVRVVIPPVASGDSATSDRLIIAANRRRSSCCWFCVASRRGDSSRVGNRTHSDPCLRRCRSVRPLLAW